MRSPKFNVSMSVATVPFILTLKLKAEELSYCTGDLKTVESFLATMINNHSRQVPNTSHYQLDIAESPAGLNVNYNGLAVIKIERKRIESYTS